MSSLQVALLVLLVCISGSPVPEANPKAEPKAEAKPHIVERIILPPTSYVDEHFAHVDYDHHLEAYVDYPSHLETYVDPHVTYEYFPYIHSEPIIVF